MRRGFGLQPLAHAVPDPRLAFEQRVQKRCERAWPLIVGPALVEHTCVIRVRRQCLVMGCWRPELVPHLRKTIEQIWPQLQEKLRTFLRLEFQKIEVVPCDPPAPPAPRQEKLAVVEDPLLAVLKKYRELGKTPGR